MNKISLYYNTVKYMKPSQIVYRVKRMIGLKCSLGVSPSANFLNTCIFESPYSLDFDSVFLSRFPVDELMNDRITILHESEKTDWKSKWNFENRSDLWNFNLHYFEYLFPLIKEWMDKGDRKYLDKTIRIISGWIESNPRGSNPGWASYTIALRIVSWISWYKYVCNELDDKFKKLFLSSLHDQYVYLSMHLEKDILGNHYFENLKSLVIASIFFKDDRVFDKALIELKRECKEEILPDGMHFELSPMYHKIIFEGVLRTTIALRSVGKRDDEIERYIKPMLNVAYSLENGLKRIPLFNDGGNNVAKGLDALVSTAGELGYTPEFKRNLEDSGFYIFQKDINGHKWKVIVDAGQPGPEYNPGHSHCDAMSYELFCDGKPVIVNCGTYAYQHNERVFFRSSLAHNTVIANKTEQSQCWGIFRLAKRSSIKVIKLTENSIVMEMEDQKKQRVKRTIKLTDILSVTDESIGNSITSFIHFRVKEQLDWPKNTVKYKTNCYAEDYGHKEELETVIISGNNIIKTEIDLRKLV